MAVEATTAAGPAGATPVTTAIRKASQVTGAKFSYLLATAKVESNLNPNAAAKTSSAGGLFQFIDRTWVGTLKEAGPHLGYERYADAITRTSDGRYVISDPSMRREIMALRQDPTANALMAGVFTNSNAKHLTNKLGRAPTDGELYMAHFMGAGGAAAFLSARDENGSKIAADLFPAAAGANKAVFYDTTTGRAKTLDEVYAFFDAKFTVPEEIESQSVVTAAAKSYESPFTQYAAPSRLAAKTHNDIDTVYKTLAANSNIPSAYQNMISNPLELMLLTQLDIPVFESKSGKYSIF